MQVKTGYLYHIKDEFFDYVNDDSLMTNHERGKKRPTYFTIKDGDILWFIPLSSKVDKYQKIVNQEPIFCSKLSSLLLDSDKLDVKLDVWPLCDKCESFNYQTGYEQDAWEYALSLYLLGEEFLLKSIYDDQIKFDDNNLVAESNNLIFDTTKYRNDFTRSRILVPGVIEVDLSARARK